MTNSEFTSGRVFEQEIFLKIITEVLESAERNEEYFKNELKKSALAEKYLYYAQGHIKCCQIIVSKYMKEMDKNEQIQKQKNQRL